jgi:ketosteroid isomerase-like protein
MAGTMRLYHYFIGALVCHAALSTQLALAGEATKLPNDLAEAVKGYDKAQIDGSRALLETYLADDYALVNGSAQIENKAQMIAESTAVGFHMKPYVVRDQIVRVWSTGAVMAGLVEIEGEDGGKPFRGRMRFADIWRKRDGRWQVVFTEVTRVPAK